MAPTKTPRPISAVWELTLRCNQACRHCGSRAGRPRERELDTGEALRVVRQLAEAGVREVTLMGGEAFLRDDWDRIALAIGDAGLTEAYETHLAGRFEPAIAGYEAALERHPDGPDSEAIRAWIARARAGQLPD